MAKALKKRALAEYQSQTTTTDPDSDSRPAPPPSPKRLKLRGGPRSARGSPVDTSIPIALETEINNLDAARSSTENFKALSRIALFFPSNNERAEALLLAKIKSLYIMEKNAALKAKCLTLMQLLKISQHDLIGTNDSLIRMISNETSPIVIVSGLNVAVKLASSISNVSINRKLLALAKKFIKLTDAKIKCKCLNLIAVLCDVSEESDITETLKFVHAYSYSHEPRVRTAAFKTLIQLHERGAKLDASVYSEITKYLNDDYESVRLAAIQLLWCVSQAYPENQVAMVNCPGEQMRLIDDAFAKICHSINDPCVQVRVLAATLLGKMPQVGQTFLDQTLDKKLMSDMRRKKSAHERQWEKVKSGEWSSGKNWADDAPQEVIDADAVTLISSGAAGAFVHGLEDEFMEVRSATVDSLCTLALKSPDFSNLALDFLVDMFNDEIEEVRLKAIDSLTKISKYIVLWEDQLEIIMGALEDSSIDIREGLHKLLSVCHLMTKDCVNMVLEKVLENLAKYPQDKKSIWKCLEGVGRNHPWVVLPLVPQLLSMHPFFDTSEPDPEDPAYVCVLILVLNAAKGCNTMSTLFDEKLIRHYHYLRDTLPHLVPNLNLGQDENGVAEKLGQSASNGTSVCSGKLVLRDLTTKLKNAEEISPEMKYKLSKLILNDLKRIAEVDREISAVAKFTALYIRAQLVFTNCLSSESWIHLTQNQQNEPLKLQIKSFHQMCLKLQYTFSDVNVSEQAVIMQLKLRALALNLVYIVRGSNASALASCQHLIEQSEKLQKFLEDNSISPDAFTKEFFEILDKQEDPKPGTLSKLLLPLFEMFPIPLVYFSSAIRMTSATIVEPSGESDTPIKFTAGLLLGISLDAEFTNLTNSSYVRIQIKYPDQQVHLICPRVSDFRSVGEDQTRLLTTIRISHQAWTEPCPVSVSIVLDLSGAETNYNRKLFDKNDSTYIIPLSEEKQVLVSPKPAKRGL